VTAASVVVRVKNEAGSIGRTFESLRGQTVPVEIVVVDSGSSDGTLELARRVADQVIEIPAERFSYGYSLNVGASAASAPIHFALSAHCVAPRHDWVERTLEHYERERVGGVNGGLVTPFGAPLKEPWVQTLEEARRSPFWGFSNHGSSWRAATWAEHRFDEHLEYAEDKEWALRVLAGGWELVYDPELHVDMTHQWRGPRRQVFDRQLRAHRALAQFTELPPYPARALLSDWVAEVRRARRPLRPVLMHLGRYVGQRQAARLTLRTSGRQVDRFVPR
jgi:rhamnosyltransferase